MTTITKEQAQEIIDAADEVITALAGTNEDVHPDNSQEMIRLYDDLNDHYAPPEVVRELARIALVSLTAEPVAWRLVDSPESSVTVTDNEKMAAIWKRNGRNVQPLYSTAHGSADAVGMVVSEGRQPSAHNPESRIFEVLVESGYEPVPGDKLYAAPPVQETGVYKDMLNIISLLENNEWAEHCTSTVLGSLLESEITRLVGKEQPASEREQIRREHAEWSDKTFGDVGPVGSLKHLSKEAVEAAAEPDDLSEWADMQFLLWDAQRRAGITDELITQAMIEKLAANKQREWPAPRDGEPRPHIKDMPAPEENGLLPCPFCGGKAHQLTIERDDDPHFGGDVITCTECGASSHVEFGFKENLKSAWNSRAAMFRDLSQPVDPQISEYERIMLQAGNSPVIPEGYALVPVEPTDEMIEAAMNCEDVLFNSDESFCVQFGNIYEAMLAAAPQPEISDGK
ncbi:restriction alleviation protein, Lar family [Salmonella enterica]|nr:restriction alleviation protein, Lar family [Salmonella enterica]EHG4610899.1 restriction alleviation protein, Lar family [Salmonella enterica subsp. enterica serovar Newport]EEO9334762.1 restriction alleviation protein, Lar family [Salmonella enterica]EEP0985886.1 restriction alleviation protein, Lar family [Salmonella enterica]EGD1172504.1 restriction alleviation protein, Lar family [Salmonella enterica]